MRHLTTLSLALALALASAGATVSQVTDHPGIQRCNAGLQRSIAVCDNMHEAGSSNWKKCLDYSISMHLQCVTEVVAHMDTLEPA